MAKNYPPKLKFQIVLELLQGEHSVGQLAKSYSVHPNSILKWKRELLEKGPQLFAQDHHPPSPKPSCANSSSLPNRMTWVFIVPSCQRKTPANAGVFLF